ncbi:AraC family transcriptional regulator [Cellulosilyticum sp. I15G10I2]|uniref:AraC family transcriptional regulator n=1 Tax=Cellulosilyticum sp. I15G10I2 TaxID=1892843 RepID=UPI00085C1075|nr:AraC family transcriptional regulator [Cellulosilyticum sp. I15G10I2]
MEFSNYPTMIYFVQKECSTNWKLNAANINFCDLVFVQSGSADYIIDKNPYHVVAGDVVCIQSGSSRIASTTGMTCVSIDFLVEDNDLPIPLPHVTSNVDLTEFEPLFTSIKYEWLQQTQGYRLKCQALFGLILYKLLYKQNNIEKSPYIKAIKKYVIEHYQENITVTKLAKLLKLNPVYCGSLFKKSENQTIQEFITQVRINKAANLLQLREHNVSEVAALTGFNDIYYFSNTFKRIMKVSPSEYKNSHLNTVL